MAGLFRSDFVSQAVSSENSIIRFKIDDCYHQRCAGCSLQSSGAEGGVGAVGMRLFKSKRGKPFRWACAVLVLIGLCIAYPTVSRKLQTVFAERALRERNAEAALGWLESIPEWNRVGQTHLLFAKAYRRQGKLDLVREHLLTAWDQGVPVERLELEQWLTLAQSGQIQEAEPHLQQLLQDPGDDAPEICEALVAGYFRNYQIARAMPLLTAWEADFPDDPRPYELRGIWFQDAGRWKEAAATYEKALKRAPDLTRIRRGMAVCLRELHEYDKAETQFLQCLRETPDDSVLLVAWGELLLASGKIPEARSVLQQVLNSSSENTDARIAMGRVLLMDGDAKAAIELLEPLYDENPIDSEIQYSLASALQASGASEQAGELFRKVTAAEEQLRHRQELIDSLDHDPNQPEVRYEIAMISMNHVAPEEGLRWLLSVIDLNPRHTASHVALADYYHRIGNLEPEEKHRGIAKSLTENKSDDPPRGND